MFHVSGLQGLYFRALFRTSVPAAPLRRVPAAALALGACLALLAAPVRAAVIVVAADGSGDYTTLIAAAMAAVDGDTLLVRPGTYGNLTVGVSKSITVTSDGTGPVVLNGYVAVLNQLAGKTVVISGLTAKGVVGSGGPVQGHGFLAVNCAGSVRVQNCDFTGAAGDPDGWKVNSSFQMQITGHAAGWHAALVQNCSGTVSFNDCSFTGGTAAYMASYPDPDCGCTFGEPGGDALHVLAGTVALTDCEGEAGYGATADREGGLGGSAVNVVSGQAVLSGCDFEGGNGGGAFDFLGEVFGGDGGSGVLAAAGADVMLLDNELLGGAGGASLSGDVGAPGEAIGGAGGQDVVIFSGASRHLGITAPAYVGGNVSLTLDGTPGDLFLLQVSAGNAWLPTSKFHGVVSVALPALGLALGTLPASGQLVLTAPVPAIAPLAALNVYLQAFGGSAADASVTGESVLLLLDPAGL
ncbi:MAG TPA: hypothetical protein VK824_07915 [Planctomycetota bacterium]|nr:hypothetical protein [Planctomycetota bacterium]